MKHKKLCAIRFCFSHVSCFHCIRLHFSYSFFSMHLSRTNCAIYIGECQIAFYFITYCTCMSISNYILCFTCLIQVKLLSDCDKFFFGNFWFETKYNNVMTFQIEVEPIKFGFYKGYKFPKKFQWFFLAFENAKIW